MLLCFYTCTAPDTMSTCQISSPSHEQCPKIVPSNRGFEAVLLRTSGIPAAEARIIWEDLMMYADAI